MFFDCVPCTFVLYALCHQSFLSEMAYLMSPFQRPCMFRAGRVDVDVKDCSGWRQVRRGCMFSAGRSVFWCPLMGAESDFCGRNGRWKGLIFRHNRVFVQNQGAVLKKSSLRGVHPGDFSSRQGENERRPISCAHSSWIKRSTLLCRKLTRVHPVVSFPLLFFLAIESYRTTESTQNRKKVSVDRFY